MGVRKPSKHGVGPAILVSESNMPLLRYSLDTNMSCSTCHSIFKFQKGSSEALNFYIIEYSPLPNNRKKVNCYWGSNIYFMTLSSYYCVIKGPLGPVSNIIVNNSTDIFSLLWQPPFTLNLSNVEPNIVYCIDVYAITCGIVHVFGRCDILQLYFHYSINDSDPRSEYQFIITPRSNVAGAINGTSSEPITGRFMASKFGDHSCIQDVSIDYVALMHYYIVYRCWC